MLAITAAVWRHLPDLSGDAFSNVLYGFGVLNFHPGTLCCCPAFAKCGGHNLQRIDSFAPHVASQ